MIQLLFSIHSNPEPATTNFAGIRRYARCATFDKAYEDAASRRDGVSEISVDNPAALPETCKSQDYRHEAMAVDVMFHDTDAFSVLPATEHQVIWPGTPE